MASKSDDINADVDSLAMTFSKRLGRLEMLGRETVFQLAGLLDRCGALEDAMVKEHLAREADGRRIKQLEEIVSKLEMVACKIEDQEYSENNGINKKVAKLEEEKREDKTNFLELVESCLVMEEKVKKIESNNVKTVEVIKDVQIEKETLRSLTQSHNSRSSDCNSSSKPVNNLSSYTTTSASLTQPPPLLGAADGRILVPTPPQLIMTFQPLNSEHGLPGGRGLGLPGGHGHGLPGGHGHGLPGSWSVPSNAKTVLCKNWAAKGSCNYEDTCNFAHGEEQIRDSKQLYKTKMCKQFAEDQFCKNGDECTFAVDAGLAELSPGNVVPSTRLECVGPQYKTSLCKLESCQYGSDCWYAHEGEELRTVRQNLAEMNPHYKVEW
eukprot:GFUD01024033.1.p1 GENE.GFUD01024033.1~~GFUD01024033.1.p1  ORF type:complete len:400 (+),score=127.13 GFUD01024033.1:58-1200(+)